MHRVLAFLAFFSAITFDAGDIHAQAFGTRHFAIEAQIADADQVVLATISKLKKQPHPILDHNGKPHLNIEQFKVDVTLKVLEMFKGDAVEELSRLELRDGWEFDRLSELKTSATEVLCFVQAQPKDGSLRYWSYRILGKPNVKISPLANLELAPSFNQKFEILKTEEDVLRRVREYGPVSEQEKIPGKPSTISLRLPAESLRGMVTGSWNDVDFPVNAALEDLAYRFIKTPSEFLPRNENKQPYSVYQLRIAGIQALSFFKNDSTVALLTKLLEVAPAGLETQENKPIRIAALERLLAWDVSIPNLTFQNEITELDLSGTIATEEKFAFVGSLKNLKTLKLKLVTLSRDRILQLKGLNNLTLIETQTVIRDFEIQAFSDIGLLHALNCFNTGAPKRPSSGDEVTAIYLAWSDVSDASLKLLAEFQNVTYFDVRDTKVTDAGIDSLLGMKKLKFLHLDETAVTDTGVRKLVAFEELEILGLSKLPITDKSIDVLRKMPNLKYLRIGNSKMTKEGSERLKTSMRNVKFK